jgi:hypothetical protein
MTTELLPRPFCGATEDKLSYNASWNEIQCQNCGATNPTVSRHAPLKVAVTAWNTRVLVAQPAPANPIYDARCAMQDKTDWSAS